MKLSIKEIELKLANNTEISEEFIQDLKKDERKGVQKLALKWEREKEKHLQLVEQFQQMSQYEKSLWAEGISFLAGIDEVGRGPLAGPVVAAAVVLPKDFHLLGLTDSKKVPKDKRQEFFDIINKQAIAVGVGIISPAEIDKVNIYEATKLAMIKAIDSLSVKPEHLLIDAMKLPLSTSQTSLIKGDSRSISIAASSIIAKVTRDNYMEQLHEQYPHYRFDKHMGYGTPEHLEAIDKYGVCIEHRKSFAPVRERCTANTLF